MLNQTMLHRRLEKLREYVLLLEKLSKSSKSDFAKDPLVKGSVERYLQLAIQVCLDIGNHILAHSKTKAPEEYRDIFVLLGEERILPDALASRMAPLASLRNLLVHDYLEVDSARIYEFLQKDLDDFKTFAYCIGQYVSPIEDKQP